MARESKPASSFQMVTALARGIEVLRCFDSNRTELGTAEISKMTGLPQPTVWRLARTLVQLGCLMQGPSGRLRVGLGVLGLGTSALAASELPKAAFRQMQRLADDAGAAVSLCIPSGMDMLIVERAQGSSSVVLNNTKGSKLPIDTSSAGWAYLAIAPEKRKQALYARFAKRHGKKWPSLISAIEKSLISYESSGYILNNGVYHPDIRGIAVPIAIDDDGKIFTLGCGGTQPSVKQLKDQIAPQLLNLARSIRPALTEQYGFRPA